MDIALVDVRWRGHHTPYVALLARYFREAGHDVTFVTSERHERLDEVPTDEIDVERLALPWTDVERPNAPLGQLTRTRQLARVLAHLRESEHDVVHFLYYDNSQVPFDVASRAYPLETPTVVTLHRDYFLSAPASRYKRVTHWVTRRAVSHTATRARPFVVTTHADRMTGRLRERVPGIDGRDARTLPAPTPRFDVAVTPRDARERLDLPTDRPLFLFFGELREEKGPDLLAAAIADLDVAATVVFAGAPAEFDGSELRAWRANASDAVEMVLRPDRVPEADLPYYFAAPDALVLPYRRTRGVSGPLRRACDAHTPVVANAPSDVGDVVERHGLGRTFETGSVRDLRRVLAGVATDGLDVDEAALDAYAESQHWTRAGETLEAIYRDVA